MKKSILTDIAAALFILLFVYAALSKVIDYQKFSIQIGQSPMLTAFAGTVAWSTPGIEIVTSLLLLFDRSRLVGLYASLVLMTIFSTYIVVITNYSEYVPCSCGGILQRMNWHEHLVFNIIFLLLAVAGILSYTPQTLHVQMR